MKQTEDDQTILQQRARALSQVAAEDAETSVELFPVVPFLLSNETYAIELKYVRLVHPLVSCVNIPGTPEFILGITSIEGALYSVTDLKPFFSLPSKGITNFNKLMVIQEGEMQFALLVNEVMAVCDVDPSSLDPLEQWHGADNRFIKGVTPERMIILDAKALLSNPDLQINTSNTQLIPQESR